MRTKPAFLLIAIAISTACFLRGTAPTATVRAFIAGAEKGDVDAMTKLFSTKAIQKTGLERVRANNQSFSEMVRRSLELGSKLKMNSIEETVNGDIARVSFAYQDKDTNDSIGLGFLLSKESGAWKIDDIGGRDFGDVTNIDAPEAPPVLIAPAPEQEQQVSSSGRPVKSVGALDSQATNLPQPSYPPLAKAAKASGKVVVEVEVDEYGKVLWAAARSGHPLLHAAAVAAARQAEFKPTLEYGKPIRVKGTIIYNFKFN